MLKILKLLPSSLERTIAQKYQENPQFQQSVVKERANPGIFLYQTHEDILPYYFLEGLIFCFHV